MIPTKQEEIQSELDEDKIREASNEYSDGAMDTWIGNNFEDLVADFIDTYNNEWISFCRERWRVENE